MPPFVQQVIGVLVRTVVVWLAAWVAAHGGPRADGSTLTKIATEIAPVVAVLTWSIWQKYHNRIKLLTALATPQPMTEAHVEATVRAAVATGSTPPVNTPKFQIPAI